MMIIMSIDVGLFLTILVYLWMSLFMDVTNITLTMTNESDTIAEFTLQFLT